MDVRVPSASRPRGTALLSIVSWAPQQWGCTRRTQRDFRQSSLPSARPTSKKQTGLRLEAEGFPSLASLQRYKERKTTDRMASSEGESHPRGKRVPFTRQTVLTTSIPALTPATDSWLVPVLPLLIPYSPDSLLGNQNNLLKQKSELSTSPSLQNYQWLPGAL